MTGERSDGVNHGSSSESDVSVLSRQKLLKKKPPAVSRQKSDEAIDIASQDSFPCSDPPGYGTV